MIHPTASPYAWGQFFHTVTSSWMLAGFFVLGISAWHLARRNEGELFRKSVRIAAPFTLIMALLVAVAGHQQGMIVAEYQPAKLAAMESHWETGSNVPMYVLAWPDEEARQNSVQAIPLPGVLSFMAFGNFHAEVKGLDAFPADDIPPVLLSFLSFRLMVALGGLFILLAAWAWLKRGDLASSPLLTRLLVWLVPLPYIGIMAGWMLAEVGRQPWIVYGLMRTSDAVSPVPASSVGLSLLAFIVIYTALGILDVYLPARVPRPTRPAASAPTIRPAPCPTTREHKPCW